MKRLVELSVVALISAVFAGAVATGQGKRPAEAVIVTVVPDAEYGVVVVKADPATGEIQYRVPRQKIEEVLKEREAGGGKQKDINEIKSLLKKDWLNDEEY